MKLIDDMALRVSKIRANVASACEQAGRSADDIIIMAVTKYTDIECVNAAAACGITHLGENRVQEFMQKVDKYTLKAANIHFIGHLQTNKVKYIIDKVSMIESVDSFRLAQEIDNQVAVIGRPMEILLEVNIVDEPTKSGFGRNEVETALRDIAMLPNVRVMGLMCVPPKEEALSALKQMQLLFAEIGALELPNVTMKWLSTGMSGCYREAILCGANIIRIGSALFK